MRNPLTSMLHTWYNPFSVLTTNGRRHHTWRGFTACIAGFCCVLSNSIDASMTFSSVKWLRQQRSIVTTKNLAVTEMTTTDITLPDPEVGSTTESSKIPHDVSHRTVSSASESRKKGKSAGGCSACGPMANIRDIDPDLVRRARMLATKRSRSLGFLKADEKPRR